MSRKSRPPGSPAAMRGKWEASVGHAIELCITTYYCEFGTTGAGLRRLHCPRHVQGNQAGSWTMGMELVVGDNRIEWTRRLSGNFGPGRGRAGISGCVGSLQRPSTQERPMQRAPKHAGGRWTQGISFRDTAPENCTDQNESVAPPSARWCSLLRKCVSFWCLASGFSCSGLGQVLGPL
ncbi:hypothetical protein VTK26DRAFT_7338 [Humicola hyalothermophila]